MDTLNRQDYIDLIQELDTNQSVKDAVISFIKTYDGTNKDEFNTLVYTIVLLLLKQEELKVKAAGYDAILENDKTGDQFMIELKEEFDLLQSGEFPDDPPTLDTKDKNKE